MQSIKVLRSSTPCSVVFRSVRFILYSWSLEDTEHLVLPPVWSIRKTLRIHESEFHSRGREFLGYCGDVDMFSAVFRLSRISSIACFLWFRSHFNLGVTAFAWAGASATTLALSSRSFNFRRLVASFFSLLSLIFPETHCLVQQGLCLQTAEWSRGSS